MTVSSSPSPTDLAAAMSSQTPSQENTTTLKITPSPPSFLPRVLLETSPGTWKPRSCRFKVRNLTMHLLLRVPSMFPPPSGRKYSLGDTHLAYPVMGGYAEPSTFSRSVFFLPCMEKECTTCARSKSSTSPPASHLLPLPTPGRPWSHIAVDFVTGLPPSHCNTYNNFHRH